jgi:hypothetical protein
MGCALRGVQHGRANDIWLASAGGVDLRCAIGIVRSNIDLGVQSQRKRPFSFHQKFAEKGASCMKGQIRASFDFPR